MLAYKCLCLVLSLTFLDKHFPEVLSNTSSTLILVIWYFHTVVLP